jgi:hypothetical protein
MCSSSRFLINLIFLFLLLSVYVPLVEASNESVVADGLHNAEEVMTLAYESVLEAEKAGANVSGLLCRLNLGGEYLAEAYVLYRLGDFDNADLFAGLCVEVVGDMRGEAIGLREEAYGRWILDVFVKLIWSILGVIGITILGFVVWRVFSRRYEK